MLQAIGTPDNAEAWLTNALNRGERIMGFGHAVYRTDDPRSVMLRDVALSLGGDLVDLAVEVERTVLAVLAVIASGRLASHLAGLVVAGSALAGVIAIGWARRARQAA